MNFFKVSDLWTRYIFWSIYARYITKVLTSTWIVVLSYESGDGSKAEQSGELKTIDKDQAGEVVQGSYEYTAPDGQHVQVSYTADENGYQAHGNVLPEAPPVPEAIARSLKFIEEHPYVEPSSTSKSTWCDLNVFHCLNSSQDAILLTLGNHNKSNVYI